MGRAKETVSRLGSITPRMTPIAIPPNKPLKTHNTIIQIKLAAGSICKPSEKIKDKVMNPKNREKYGII